MNITTWNIQAGQGVDGRIDVPRIAEVIKDLGDSDIICLQEITRETVPSPVPSNKSVNSFGLADDLANLFPEYEMFFGPAVDRVESAGRYYFGNMILSKVPVNFVFSHKLPQPPDPTTRTMPRQALEVLVTYNDEPLRIVTTHLEFFAIQQRKAQLQYLGQYQAECCERFAKPSPSGTGSYVAPPETDRTIMCGDFNMEANVEHYKYFTEDAGDFIDSWIAVHGTVPHAPTCGIYDLEQWPNGEHCRDFFFLSPSLVRFAKGLIVNTDTQASDHQPLRLTLA